MGSIENQNQRLHLGVANNITLYSKQDHLVLNPCFSIEDDEETCCSFGNGELVTFYRQWSFGDSVPTSPAVDNKVYW